MSAKITAAICALCLALAPLQAGAQSQDFAQSVMAPGLVAALGAPVHLRYAHIRTLPPAPEGQMSAPAAMRPLRAVNGGEITLEWDPAAEASAEEMQLWAHEAGEDRLLAPFSPRGPNPLLIFFLENVLRAMAAATGGNPDYIRNRMRLQIGALTPLRADDGLMEVTFLPFEGDAQAGRMGPFAALQLTIRWPEDQPGALALLSATLKGHETLYQETLRRLPQE